MLFGIEIIALAGFLLGAYSIVANDVIQTLGTFLSSNGKTPWPILWLFASVIIVAAMLTGTVGNGGDIAFDRLDQIPYRPLDLNAPRPGWWAAWDPPGGVEWYHVAPPLALLALTRFGVPVSTTFLVLTVFTLTTAESLEANVLPSMLVKSGLGYVVAFGSAILVYLAVSRTFETWVARTRDKPVHLAWTLAQWVSTGYLWWNWLVQDLANIFVFLPRQSVETELGVAVRFDPALIVFATLLMLALHAFLFQQRGGEIQKIVTSKTNTTDIRSATMVDFIYGSILLVFQQINNVPMSTTWVFLGLLAGRELAIAYVARLRRPGPAGFDLLTDIMRALIGLCISVALAIGIPRLAGAPALADIGYGGVALLALAAFLLGGGIWALRRWVADAQPQPA